MSNSELKPCPKCHSHVGLYWGDCHRIACHGCNIQYRGVGGMSKEQLIEEWNTRKIEFDWGDKSLVGMLRQYSALGGTLAVGHQEGATMGAAADRIEELEAQVDRMMYCTPVENNPNFHSFIRAFWRRIEPFKSKYGKELPDELPIEFRAHMATASTLLTKK